MNASMSRRRLLGLAAAASAVAAIQRELALGGDAPPPASMPRLAVCIDALFTGVPFEERPAKVKSTGLNAFEFWGWRGRDMDRLARIREELGMEVIGFACDTGGPLVAPGSAKRIMAPLKDTLSAARKLDCHEIIAQVGNELKDVPRAQQHKNCVEAFRAAASSGERRVGNEGMQACRSRWPPEH
jgi:sugar phosphate isomerase/epimerase